MVDTEAQNGQTSTEHTKYELIGIIICNRCIVATENRWKYVSSQTNKLSFMYEHESKRNCIVLYLGSKIN